jgi:hypothetical protein
MVFMKKIFLSAILFSGITGLFSCTKFLKEQPKSSQPLDAYFQTAEQAQSAVNYLYTKDNGPGSFFAARGYYDGTLAFAFDNMSGLSNNTVAQDPGVRFWSSLTQNTDGVGNYVGGIWTNFYESIANANTIIARVAASDKIDTVSKAPVLATARFFRALDYYFLVRLFGAVPLVLTPYTSPENLFAPRTSVDSVYGAITADLVWALNNGGLVDKPMGSNANLVSKGTVAAVLSEVYLTMAGYPLQKGADYYTKALATANTILTSGGGYALFDNSGGTTAFDKLRLTNFDKGSEYLFFEEYDASIQSNGYPLWAFPNSFPAPIPESSLSVKYATTTADWVPSTSLLNLYDSVNDIRRHNRQYYHNSFTYAKTTGGTATITYPTAPFRWFDSVAIFGTGASGKYTCVYRLADVYLIAAEAANELGQDPTAYIQPILNRAYVTPPVVPAGQAGRRNLVLAERFRELAMENHFWFDMLRTRLYPDADASHNVSFSALVGHGNGRGQTYATKDLLIPLPPTEIQRNPQLRPQNPGY